MPTMISNDQLPTGLKWSVCINQQTVEITTRDGRSYARLIAQPDKALVFDDYREFIRHLTTGTFDFA